MAWLEQEDSGIYYICFRYQGVRIKRSTRTREESKAEAMLGRIDENIGLVERGRLYVPDHADVFSFLLSDGQINTNKPAKIQTLKLSELYRSYRDSLPADALGADTLRIAEIHSNHVSRIIGPSRRLNTIVRDDLQRYVNSRTAQTGKRGKPISPDTIRKELSTFRTLWRWAKLSQFVTADFPNQGLHFPRQRQKLPFSTWEQIELRVKRGLPAGHCEADYWDCLYLNKSELDALLGVVEKYAGYDFLYPMCVIAAHTGARRSELCRSMRSDVDFESEAILIREKKRQKGRETFRHVPMSRKLQTVLTEWFNLCAPSAYTFPAEHRVSRLRNQNRRENDESVSPDEATDHLKKALCGTRWERIRGWHIFRHSFISNCASLSVDQRMIDAWVGHQTEEMRRRYRHLFPHRQRIELDRVFG